MPIIPETDAPSAPAAAAGHLQACSPRRAATHAHPNDQPAAPRTGQQRKHTRLEVVTGGWLAPRTRCRRAVMMADENSDTLLYQGERGQRDTQSLKNTQSLFLTHESSRIFRVAVLGRAVHGVIW